MNDELPTGEENALPTIISDTADTIGDVLTGVPAPLRKALGKAAAKLVLGLVEIPANYLEAKARGIKHRQEMREKLHSALTNSEIKRLPQHPDLADRALEHHVSEIIGKQENRESVLVHAARELAEDTHQTESLPPPGDIDDDWLGSFSGYAEKASSERLRQLFGRVLAGEIRKPNSFSLFTLDLLSKLGQADAALIVQFAPFVIQGSIVLTPKVKALFSFSVQSRLGELGIVTSTSIGAANASRTMVLSATNLINGKPGGALVRGDKVVVMKTNEPKTIAYECSILTTAGSEILSPRC